MSRNPSKTVRFALLPILLPTVTEAELALGGQWLDSSLRVEWVSVAVPMESNLADWRDD